MPIRTRCRAHAAARDDRAGAGLQAEDPVADEPTTALDATVQIRYAAAAGVATEFGMSVISSPTIIGVRDRNLRRVAVMYAGQIVGRAR